MFYFICLPFVCVNTRTLSAIFGAHLRLLAGNLNIKQIMKIMITEKVILLRLK